MSFEHIRRLRRTVGFRLTAGYFVLLLLTLLLLGGFADWQLRRALAARDRATIVAEMDELERDFADEGMSGIEEEATETTAFTNSRRIYLRIVDSSGSPIWDDAWITDQTRDPVPADVAPGTWKMLRTTRGDVLEMQTRRLAPDRLLQAAASTSGRMEAVEAFRETLFVVVLPVLLLGFLGGLLISRNVLRPLRDLAALTRQIAKTGIMTDRIPARGNGDELDDMAMDFNNMMNRIDQLVSGIRETLDNVAHDLRTPMTTLRGRIELALRNPSATEQTYQSALEDAMDASGQVTDVLNAIMDESEARAGTLPLRRTPTALRDVADGVADLYQYVAEDRDITLNVRGDQSVHASIDAARMRQAIANLVDNAMKYTASGGTVEITVSMEGQEPVIRVTDTGVGIPDVDLPRIWDRLYRGDASRSTRGLGLGLSLVQAIVDAHGGTVTVESTEKNGSAFTIRLGQTVS